MSLQIFVKTLSKSCSKVIVADYQSYFLSLKKLYSSVSSSLAFYCSEEAVAEGEVALCDVWVQSVS